MSFAQNQAVLADIYKGHERKHILETGEYSSHEISRPNSRKFSSVCLPSIDSAFGGSESMSPVSTSLSREDGSTSELSLDDFDDFRGEEKFSTKVKKEDTYILTDKDMQDIESRVEEKFREDFKKIWQDAKAKELRIKKKFTKVIDSARSTLIEARVYAEKKAINRLEERAEEKQNEIREKRSKRKWEILAGKGKTGGTKHNFGAGDKWVQEQMEEMATLRKIQADLDRARARRRNGIASMSINNKGKLRKLMQTEIRRLERIDEIHHLMRDLSELGLSEQADSLQLALQSKEHADLSLRNQIKEERGRARIEAWKKKEEEVAKLRQERIEEMERLEKERKAREEKERHARIMAALARKAHNQALRRGYDQTLINSRISRPHTFTYFPSPVTRK